MGSSIGSSVDGISERIAIDDLLWKIASVVGAINEYSTRIGCTLPPTLKGFEGK